MKFRFPDIPLTWIWSTVAILLVGIGLGLSDRWIPSARQHVSTIIALFKEQPATAGEEKHDEHEGHDHAGHDESTSLELSEQARKNIGLTDQYIRAIKLQTFNRSITVPAVVTERPGKTRMQVAAPMTGVVSGVYIVKGEAVTAGGLLFRMRLTHEDLVKAQTMFLQSLGDLNVIEQDINRLRKLTKGLAPSKLRDRLYEQQKLQVVLRAHREELLLHGLTEEQIQSIDTDGRLVRETEMRVPLLNPDGSLRHYSTDNRPARSSLAATSFTNTSLPKTGQPPVTILVVRELNVNKGQLVIAGQPLCVLADYGELHLEGRAFEHDVDDIKRAAQKGWPVTAIRETRGNNRETIGGLQIVHLDNEIDLVSRAFHFDVRLSNSIVRESDIPKGNRFVDWRFRPGQRMQMEVPVEEWPDRIVLPIDAVAQEGVEFYVFQQNGDHFDRRPVHVEYQDQSWVVIANDGSLFPGDVVAFTGAHQMQMALKNKAGSGGGGHGHMH